MTKRLKLSKWTIFVPFDENYYAAYNTLFGGIAILDKEAKNFLDKIKYQGISIEDIKNPEIKEIIQNLINANFLIDEDLDENILYRYFFNRKRFNYFHGAFLILTTYRCNLACNYCYQGPSKRTESMSISTAELIVKWIQKLLDYRNTKVIGITFYGGEPLLNLKALKFISEKLLRWSNTEKRELSIGIITNGVLLTKSLANNLVDNYGLERVHVTFDGNKDYHDKLRCFPNGKGTFDIILSNLLNYVDYIKDTIVRINIDKLNFESSCRLLDVFKEHGLEKRIRIYFARRYAWRPEIVSISSIVLSEVEFEEESIKLYNIAVKKGFNVAFEVEPVICDMYLDNHFIIDPGGKIFKCWDLIGSKEFEVGDINKISSKENFHPEDDVLSLKYYEILGIDPIESETCKNCPYLPLCNGGCRARSYTLRGSIKIPDCTIEAFNRRRKLLTLYIRLKYGDILRKFKEERK